MGGKESKYLCWVSDRCCWASAVLWQQAVSALFYKYLIFCYLHCCKLLFLSYTFLSLYCYLTRRTTEWSEKKDRFVISQPWFFDMLNFYNRTLKSRCVPISSTSQAEILLEVRESISLVLRTFNFVTWDCPLNIRCPHQSNREEKLFCATVWKARRRSCVALLVLLLTKMHYASSVVE